MAMLCWTDRDVGGGGALRFVLFSEDSAEEPRLKPANYSAKTRLQLYRHFHKFISGFAEKSAVTVQSSHLFTVQVGAGLRVDPPAGADVRGTALRHEDRGLGCASLLWRVDEQRRGAEGR